ncbi:MAG: DUF3015 family protein [Bdellovibrionota bacterium]
MKTVLNIAAVIALTVLSHNAHALKFKKCVSKSMKTADMNEKSTSSFTKLLNRLTAQTFTSSSTSTTSFTSSIGECGAFAVFKVREQFIAENFNQLREESARGEGEYLSALAALSGCDSQVAQNKFQTTVRSQFNSLYYPGESSLTPSELGRQVDNVIKSDSTLNHMCQFIG